VDLNHEQCFVDLIYDQFDLAQFTGANGEKVLYRAISETGINENDKSVEYRYNDNYFRSDNFTKTHEGLHILFSGCSESEGVGDNIEHAWTKILYDKISKETECSGFFNLSRAGWGWSKIVINTLIYFEKYGYPDILFITLPNHQRKHTYSEDGFANDNGDFISNWRYVQSYPSEFYEIRKKANPLLPNIHTTNKKQYNEEFIFFITSWKLFNKICLDNKIKLIFSTWDKVDSKNLKTLNMFDNFVEIQNEENIQKYTEEYYNNNKITKYDIKKRDGHSGRLFHNYLSSKFYNAYKKEINNA
jgi:hypothetical protein